MYLEIAIDTPLRRTFDYRCPPSLDIDSLRPGLRIRVPFGKRRAVGILLKVKSTTGIPLDKLKSAIEILDDQPIFDRGLLDLLVWSADYYRHPIGEVLAAALPVALRGGASAEERIEIWRLTEDGAREWPALPQRSTRLRAVAAAIARGAELNELADLPSWRQSARELERRGWAQRESAIVIRASKPTSVSHERPTLSEAQEAAVQKVAASQDKFRTLLLHGVTGSGKTEVYLRAIELVVAAGKQALLLVPEISLTPQAVARFEERFTARLAILHSALSDGERLAAWRAAHN